MHSENTILILKQMEDCVSTGKQHNYTAIISNCYTTNVQYIKKNKLPISSRYFYCVFSKYFCIVGCIIIISIDICLLLFPKKCSIETHLVYNQDCTNMFEGVNWYN